MACFISPEPLMQRLKMYRNREKLIITYASGKVIMPCVTGREKACSTGAGDLSLFRSHWPRESVWLENRDSANREQHQSAWHCYQQHRKPSCSNNAVGEIEKASTGCPKKRTFRMLLEPQSAGSITIFRHRLCLEIDFLVVSY